MLVTSYDQFHVNLHLHLQSVPITTQLSVRFPFTRYLCERKVVSHLDILIAFSMYSPRKLLVSLWMSHISATADTKCNVFHIKFIREEVNIALNMRNHVCLFCVFNYVSVCVFNNGYFYIIYLSFGLLYVSHFGSVRRVFSRVTRDELFWKASWICFPLSSVMVLSRYECLTYLLQ
jgi:hypothetical protein